MRCDIDCNVTDALNNISKICATRYNMIDPYAKMYRLNFANIFNKNQNFCGKNL